MDTALEHLGLLDASPSAARARRAHRAVRERFRRGLLALVDAAADGLGRNEAELRARCESLDAVRRFSPYFFTQYYRLLAALDVGDAREVRTALDGVRTLTDGAWYGHGFSIETISDDWEHVPLRRLRVHSGPDRLGNLTVIDPLPSRVLAGYRSDVLSALSFVRTADEDMRAEVDEYVRVLKLSRGSGATGATSLQFFGAIFLSEPGPDDERVMYFYEHLIHETSHLHLNVVQTFDRLVSDDVNLYSSPLRRDPRPLIGVYHAEFVLSRMVRMYRRAPDALRSRVFEDRGKVLGQKLEQGASVLLGSGGLTDAGEVLLESMLRSATS